MAALSQPDSALLQLPTEIRDQIWKLVFVDKHVVPPPFGPPLALDGCIECSHIAGENVASESTSTPEYPSWQEVFSPLRTCKQIFTEARQYLMSSFTLHLGSPLGDPMRAIVPFLASIKESVRRLDWRVHVLEDNRVDWIASIGIVGTLFPNLEKVVIHAHMRPPDRYEALIDAIYIALPIVRLCKREMPNIQLDINLTYMSEGVMFNSPFVSRDLSTYFRTRRYPYSQKRLFEPSSRILSS